MFVLPTSNGDNRALEGQTAPGDWARCPASFVNGASWRLGSRARSSHDLFLVPRNTGENDIWRRLHQPGYHPGTGVLGGRSLRRIEYLAELCALARTAGLYLCFAWHSPLASNVHVLIWPEQPGLFDNGDGNWRLTR